MHDEHCDQKLRTAAREVFPALSALVSGFRAPVLPRHSVVQMALGDVQAQAALAAAAGEAAASSLAPWHDPLLLQAVETAMLSHNLHPNRDQAEKVCYLHWLFHWRFVQIYKVSYKYEYTSSILILLVVVHY